MAELTLEQQKALALANARRRAAEAGAKAPAAEKSSIVSALETAGDLASRANPAAYLAKSLADSVIEDARSDKKTDARDNTLGKVDSFVRGAADTASFGLSDEMAAAADAALNPVLGTGQDEETFSKRYAKNVSKERATDRADADNRFKQRLGGQLTGGMLQAGALVRAGLSPTAKAITAGKSLPKVMATGAIEGGALGAMQGLGSGEDLQDRAAKAALGGGLGLALGGGLPLVTEVARKAITPVAAYLDPQAAKDKVIATLLRRSGTTADDIAARLQQAQDDGQTMFTAADALEQPGQRILSTASRTPTDVRKTIVDALVDRQSDQGKRLSEYLSEGFNAPDTAAKRKLALEAERKMLADVNYPNARATASAVDLTGAINQIDDVLKPGVNKIVDPGSGLADDSTDALLGRFKARMTNGREQLTDFDEVLKLKSEIGDMATALSRKGEDYKASQLTAVAQRLDSALEKASPDYRAANDAYRAQSKTIDAIEKGRDATSRRVRFADTVSEFEGMKPGEQMAFRSGYSDPLIAAAEGNASAPTTNKARALLSPKMEEEFDAFAIPGRKDKMVRRLDREQKMFETANAALGGSKTADNLADAADSAIDPGIVAALARGDIKGAAVSALTSSANAARGLPPSVIEKLAPVLMETNPEAARALFSNSAQVQQLSDETRAKIIAALMNSVTSAPSRIAP